MSRYDLNEVQNEFIDYCTDFIMTNQRNKKKVPVICSPCGIGKTTTIKKLISKVLSDDDLPGMIFVTDTIKALEEVAADNIDNISLLTQENLSTEITAQKSKKILLMTSQRYFNLIAEEINELLVWDGGRRTKIIIDERAQVFKQTNINLKNLNEIDTAIENGIDNQFPDEKAWCKDQWRKLRQHLEDAMYSYEQLCAGRLELWHKDSWGTITEDNTRFFAFLEKYKSELNMKYQLFFTDLQAVTQIVTDGAIFYCQKRNKKRINAKSTEKYDKSFSVIRDNSSTLNNVAADVFVLDATADITPDYQLPYFNIIKNPRFNMDLSNLEIKIIDVQTSKQAITANTQKAKKRIATIKKIIEEEKAGKQKTAVFTYTENENQFVDIADDRVGIAHQFIIVVPRIYCICCGGTQVIGRVPHTCPTCVVTLLGIVAGKCAIPVQYGSLAVQTLSAHILRRHSLAQTVHSHFGLLCGAHHNSLVHLSLWFCIQIIART